jgi:predicted acyl esterase
MTRLVAPIFAAPMILFMATVAAQPPSPEAPAKPGPRPLYSYREEMVPVRDGVHLQTVIMVPLDARGPLPILLRRTPYGVPEKPYTEIPESLAALAAR